MAIIDIDENRWPIVIVTISGNETQKDIEDFLNRLEDFQMRNEDFCFVIDLREIKRLKVDVREILLSWLKHTDLHELAGTAMVVTSPMMRVYLSLMIWLQRSLNGQKPAFKHKTVFSLSEAYEWSRKRLQMPRTGNRRKSAA